MVQGGDAIHERSEGLSIKFVFVSVMRFAKGTGGLN